MMHNPLASSGPHNFYHNTAALLRFLNIRESWGEAWDRPKPPIQFSRWPPLPARSWEHNSLRIETHQSGKFACFNDSALTYNCRRQWNNPSKLGNSKSVFSKTIKSCTDLTRNVLHPASWRKSLLRNFEVRLCIKNWQRIRTPNC